MRSLMVSANYLDIRASRCALALKENGIEVDALTWRHPPQLRHAYRDITVDPLMGWEDVVRHIKKSTADIIHVHCELHGYWVAVAAREAAGDRPVICDIHDLNCARPHAIPEPYEVEGFDCGDAYIWVNELQRDYAYKWNMRAGDKPEVYLNNFVTSSAFIDKTPLPHLGGLVYAGGIAKRGELDSERDFSPIADLIGDAFHIYPGGEDPDYGVNHPQESRYPLYIQRLARHDWGLVGTPTPQTSWLQSMPTKTTEYFAAGIPVVVINVPTCDEFAERGMGVKIDDIRDIPKVLSLDPRPYRKAVMAQRSQFTVERIIGPVVDMYRGLV